MRTTIQMSGIIFGLSRADDGDYCDKCGLGPENHKPDGACDDDWAKHPNPAGPGYIEDV